MARSIARAFPLIASATAVGFLLAGCAVGSAGAVIGVPGGAAPVPRGDLSIDSAINQAIENELIQANQTQSANEPAISQVELNALNSLRSLVRAEAFDKLLTSGAKQIAKREGIVNTLIADVQADKYLTGVNLAGRSLSGSLLSILGGINSRLQLLGAKIASDSLPDMLRSDYLSIGPSTRVSGLVEPMTHLTIAGGDELFQLNTLVASERQLASQVAGGASTDSNYAGESSRLRDLTASIASARATIDSALAAVMSLTAGGFPANKTTIAAVRSALIQLRSPLGKIGQANADATAILELLAKR
jgi:hypothetical protein